MNTPSRRSARDERRMHPVLALIGMVIGIGAVTAAILFAVSRPQASTTDAGTDVVNTQQTDQTKDSGADTKKQESDASKQDSSSTKKESTGNKQEDASKKDSGSSGSQSGDSVSASTGNARTEEGASTSGSTSESGSNGSSTTGGSSEANGGQSENAGQSGDGSDGGTGSSAPAASGGTQSGWISAEACATNVAESGTLTASDIPWNDGTPQVGLDLASYPYPHLGAYLDVQYEGVTVRAQIVDCGHYSDIDPSGIALNPAVYEQFGALSVDDWGRREVSYRFV